MQVINLNTHPVSVKLREENGSVNYVYVQPRSRVTLPAAVTVDQNWLAMQPKVRVEE